MLFIDPGMTTLRLELRTPCPPGECCLWPMWCDAVNCFFFFKLIYSKIKRNRMAEMEATTNTNSAYIYYGVCPYLDFDQDWVSHQAVMPSLDIHLTCPALNWFDRLILRLIKLKREYYSFVCLLDCVFNKFSVPESVSELDGRGLMFVCAICGLACNIPPASP